MKKIKVIFLDTQEVKEVALGYARNYLFPQKKAVLATEVMVNKIEKDQRERKEQEAKEKEWEQQTISELGEKFFVVKAKSDASGTLFGAIAPKDIALVLGVSDTWIFIPEPIKKLGDATVRIQTPRGAKKEIKIHVETS